MSKDITNYNSKFEFHGYQEWYRYDGKSYFKGFYNNGVQIDYEEFYDLYGQLYKRFWI